MADARKAKMKARLQQKSRAMNLKFAADELRRDRKVVITACLNHPGSLIYCLDDALRTELTGLSRKQLEALLETADEDMLPKPEAPISQEQKDFEELDFEAVLRQEKASGLLVPGGGGGGGHGAGGDRDDEGDMVPPAAASPAPAKDADAIAAKRAEIAAKVAAAQAAQAAEAASAPAPAPAKDADAIAAKRAEIAAKVAAAQAAQAAQAADAAQAAEAADATKAPEAAPMGAAAAPQIEDAEDFD
jgi:hypothetical protein